MQSWNRMIRRPIAITRRLLSACMSALLLVSAAPSAQAASVRLKDIVDIEGIRDNQLIGYGLVVGLEGTGDTLNNSPFTKQSIEAMLERLGVNTRDQSVKTANVAAVMVTANLPSFARVGGRIDVRVSSLGDAKSLSGGTLLVTPLMGADGEVYAVAQGPVAIGGFFASGKAETVSKNTPTTGRIANGAIIERETGFEFAMLKSFKMSLRNPDMTTARRIAQTINTYLGSPAAKALDPSTVQVSVPDQRVKDLVGFFADIEQLRVTTDAPARVVIDEKNGIIVMGEAVRVDTVAIAQGNLTIRVTETPQVSQPNPLSQTGQTAVVDRTNVQVEDGKDKRLTVLNRGVSLQELVDGLNALGIGPRDMISILQTIKAAGALQAEIKVM